MTKNKKKSTNKISFRKRETRNAIVIGTIHLGHDVNVLKNIKAFGDDHNVNEYVHIGPLVTRDEYWMWYRRSNKLKTWEKQDKNRSKKLKQIQDINNELNDLATKHGLTKKVYSEAQAYKNMSPGDLDIETNMMMTAVNKAEKLSERRNSILSEIDLLFEKDVTELEMLQNAQQDRIDTLLSIFGDKLKIVCNEEQLIPYYVDTAALTQIDWLQDDIDFTDAYIDVRKSLGDQYAEDSIKFGKYLRFTSVPANGDKVSGSPITQRTYVTMSYYGGSHIIPHPITCSKSYEREGLNNAFNYVTTGSLVFNDKPKKITDAHLSAARTGCVLVSLDVKTQEYFSQRIRIRGRWGSKSHNFIPHIGYDGGVWSTTGKVCDVPNKDRLLHWTDGHAPYCHRGVIGVIRATNVLFNPGVHVDGGDSADFISICPHSEGQPGRRENHRLCDDLNSMYATLHATSNPEEFPFIKQRVMLDSNHGEWLTKLVMKVPALIGIIDWETIAREHMPDWEVYIRKAGEDKTFRFGDLALRHGDKENSPVSAWRVFDNYLGGHIHRYVEYLDAVFTGPACQLGPEYLQNKTTSWQNQITTAVRYKNITFKTPKTILYTEKDKLARFVFGGQIYETNYYDM